MTALGLAAALPFNQTKGDPLLALGPVFAIRAKDSVEGEQWALNKGTGGAFLSARYGSVGRGEIRRGIGYLTNEVSSNYCSVPDAASLKLTNSLEIIGYYEGSTRPAATGYLCIKSSDGTWTNREYSVVLYNTGLLGLWSRDSSSASKDTASSSSIPSTTTSFWWKVTLNATSGVSSFYYNESPYSTDVPTSWTSLGTQTTSYSGNSLLTGTGNLFGSYLLASCVQKRLIVKSSIGGSTVLDVDFTQQNDLTTSFTCTTGQTVTVTAANAVDTNDPALNMYTGKNYLYCPGVVGNQLVYGHNAAVGSLNILEYKVKVRPNVLGAVQYMCGTDSTNFGFYLTAAGGISIYCLNTPGLVRIGDLASSAIPGLSTTRDVWLYGRLNITTAQCDYWYSFDSTDTLGNVTWIPLTGGVGSFAGTTPLLTTTVSSMIGSYSIGLAGFNGRFYVFAVLMDSVVRAHIDFTKTTPTILDGASLTGGTTYGRPNGGKKLAFVKAANWNFGGNSYMEIIDNILMNFSGTDDLTIVAVSRMWNRDVTLAPIIAKKATPYTPASDVGWHFGRNTTDMSLSTSDGTTLSQDVEALSAAGSLVISTGIRYGAGKQIAVYNNSTISSSTADSSTGVLTNTLPAQIGKVSTGYSDMELFAIYVFKNKIPTAAQIAAAVQYWQVAA